MYAVRTYPLAITFCFVGLFIVKRIFISFFGYFGLIFIHSYPGDR